MKTSAIQSILSSGRVLLAYALLQAATGFLIAQNGTSTNKPPEPVWGSVSEGFRLGLVLAKDTFTNGEPVVGKVVVQNVTGTALSYDFNVPSYQEVIVLDQRNEKLQLKDSVRPKTPFEEYLANVAHNPQPAWVEPGAENVISIKVTDRYDLPGPATYKVFFRLRVPRLGYPRQNRDVLSAQVPVRILAP